MNFIAKVAALALAFVACASAAAESGLSQRITERDGWIGYQVPMTDTAGTPCCFEWHGRGTKRADCELDGRSWSINIDDHAHAQVASDALNVYLRVAHGQIDKVRAFAASCAVRDADRVRWLDPVEPRASVALLAGLAGAVTTSQENADTEIAAVALHADATATPTLGELSTPTHPRKLREQALFWLGQARGADGAQIVERVATTDGDPELRANAVFDLSQAHGVDAYASIHRIAQSDPSEHVREQAYFWMAQMDDARAEADITAAISSDGSDAVREQAVFALSQLKDDRAEQALMALVRGHYPRKVKEQALFWLGESGSPKAMEFLDEILSRHSAHAEKGDGGN